MTEVLFYTAVGIIFGEACFRGFKAFEKLKYYARFKVVETSGIKQLRPHSGLKNITKKMNWGRG